MEIKKWLDTHFESSSKITNKFKDFASDFKEAIINETNKDFNLVAFNTGHFYLSGFLQHKRSKRFIYFSTEDVRGAINLWYNKIMIRTAKSAEDYVGGYNNFVSLKNLNKKAKQLIND